jgi:hypothetical protein
MMVGVGGEEPACRSTFKHRFRRENGGCGAANFAPRRLYSPCGRRDHVHSVRAASISGRGRGRVRRAQAVARKDACHVASRDIDASTQAQKTRRTGVRSRQHTATGLAYNIDIDCIHMCTVQSTRIVYARSEYPGFGGAGP